MPGEPGDNETVDQRGFTRILPFFYLQAEQFAVTMLHGYNMFLVPLVMLSGS